MRLFLSYVSSLSPPSSILKVTMSFDATEYMYTYTVVIIHEADSLTRDAQAALRRTMEKYMSNMRLILCANSTSKLIAPIRSRCLLMRVAAPTAEEVRIQFIPVSR